jgi:hypothetical protein
MPGDSRSWIVVSILLALLLSFLTGRGLMDAPDLPGFQSLGRCEFITCLVLTSFHSGIAVARLDQRRWRKQFACRRFDPIPGSDSRVTAAPLVGIRFGRTYHPDDRILRLGMFFSNVTEHRTAIIERKEEREQVASWRSSQSKNRSRAPGA